MKSMIQNIEQKISKMQNIKRKEKMGNSDY